MKRLDKLKQYSGKVLNSIDQIFKGNEVQYLEAVDFFVGDEQFDLIGKYIKENDFALATDATKSLMYLAEDFGLIPLYLALQEIDEDLAAKEYNVLEQRYMELMDLHEEFKKIIKE
jgi:hypothetical protein